MCKKILFALALMLCLFACNNSKSDSTGNTNQTVLLLNDLMATADDQIEKEVVVRGHVTHVCKHSGKKCFITDENGEISLQILTGGDITAFDKNLVGSEIKVKGIVKERRLSKEYIDGIEKETLEKQEEGAASAEQCAAELANVSEMREWMQKRNKDHYAIYYMEGKSYEMVD